MAQRGIREYDAKRMLAKHISGYSQLAEGDASGVPVVLIKSGPTRASEDLKKLVADHPWLKDRPLVAKPDQLFGKRGKNKLLSVGKNLEETARWIDEHMNKQVTLLSGVTGMLTDFIVEPMTPHKTEYYVAMRAGADGDTIYLSDAGGIDIEENWSTVKELAVPNLEKLDTERLGATVCEICAKHPGDAPAVQKFVEELWGLYLKGGFVYLEINPFAIAGQGAGGTGVPLDTVAKVDDTAEFECRSLWGDIEFPAPFGQSLSAEEEYVKKLDAMSGASLKLRLLNPDGRVWNMVAGGGASVIYADTVADLGFGQELAMYGEYSGDPSTQLTFEYAKTVMDLMTRKADPQGRPKYLLIGGGIANFTDVAKTFTGIIMAMEQYAEKLKKVNARIFVRRGGPNYKVGLKKIREAGEKLGLPIEVYGPETHMTDIVRMALASGAAQ